MSNLKFYLALNRIYKVGPKTVAKLQERWPCLEALFKLNKRQMEEEGLPAWLAEAISGFDMRLIEDDLRWQEKAGHHLLTWDSPQYPSMLKEIYDPPVVLYAVGQLEVLKSPMLSMVGSRNPSVTGAENAKAFAKALAASDLTIVSGLALGVDAQAHQGCLEAKGKTIAVLGTGVDVLYPKRHGHLASQIRENGLLLSEFPLKTGPAAGHFPRRNRIISGLSLATLVVEAAVKSGSLITARLALEQNRDVFAIPGSIHNPQARGCHYLLQQGAKLVMSVNDILDELGLDKAKKNEKITASMLARCNEKLVKCIGFELTTVDQIVVRSGLNVEQVACELADLELDGFIKAVPGGYMRC